MHQIELNNYVKVKTQIEQKLQAVQSLQKKIAQMDKKMTHTGYQRINSVMMRKVEIKHTSQFIIKLNEEYFAEVKSGPVLQNLQRKKKNYSQGLKNINNKILFLSKKVKKNEKLTQEQDRQNYFKSSLESIGKNQMGEEMFNIIQVNGEGDEDLSKWPKQNNSAIQSQNETSKKDLINMNKQQPVTNVQKVLVKSKQNKTLVQQKLETIENDQKCLERLQQEGENQDRDIMQDYYQGQDQEDDESTVYQKEEQLPKSALTKNSNLQTTQSLQKDKSDKQENIKKTQKNHQKHNICATAETENTISVQVQTSSQIRKQKVNTNIVTSNAPKQKQKQQAKPMSKFKLERMKKKQQN